MKREPKEIKFQTRTILEPPTQCIVFNTICISPKMITYEYFLKYMYKSYSSNFKLSCATPHHSLTIYKVSASLDQNCMKSYPETNMKTLSKGL